MRKTIFFAMILCCLPMLVVQAQSTPKATLEITFTGIRNDIGLIAIGINSSPDGWPRNPQMELNWKKTSVVDGVFTAKIESMNYGTYAISVLDDQNSNLEMDMVLGIPKEGYGFSNNPSVGISTPKFNVCAFILDKPFVKISIDLRYTLKGR